MARRWTQQRTRSLTLGLAACAVLAGCETKKSSNPLSPTVAGPIPGVTISAPKPLEPANGTVLIEGTAVSLLFENASSSGQRPIWMQLEVALDQSFSNKVHAVERLELGPNGRTSYRIPVELQPGRAYYWRARALDGANTGPYSTGNMFQVVVALRIEAPVPVSPVRREVTSTNRPTLVVTNTAIVGTPAGPVTYRFELARDLGFGQMVAIWTVPRTETGTTSVSTTDLPLDTEFYWRVSASDGAYTSALSPVQAFRTPAPVAPPPAPTPTPTPTPSPTPTPTPTPPPNNGGTVGPNRNISPEEALRIIRLVHDTERWDLGSRSTRDSRVQFFFSAMAAVHYGHPRYNPAGGDPGWCVKDAGGGRPPSDDVMVRCSSRDAWDTIGSAGANGYSFQLDYIGRLDGGQNVYPPPRSSLPR